MVPLVARLTPMFLAAGVLATCRRGVSAAARAPGLPALLLAAAIASNPASAQDDEEDDDWLFEEEDEDDEDKPKPEDDEDELEDEPRPQNPTFDEDELEEEIGVLPEGEGVDTASIYRAYLAELEGLGPDEEALAWERYLKRYPNSVFRGRIEERMAELEQEMFSARIGDGPGGPGGDAGKAELLFAQPMTLENIDPITKLRGGFELGLPNYFGLVADFEYQLARQLSVHAGLRNRYTGLSAEVGAHYAFVKSARTQTLITGIGDIRLGTNPFFPGLRPQLALGQRLNVGETTAIDIQVQGGADLAFLPTSDGETALDPRLVGGANVTIAPSSRVKVYFETSTYMKEFGEDVSLSGPFRFNTLAFGIKFVGRKSNDDLQYEIGAGAQAPYAVNYWGYHLGAINADINYYLD